MKKIGLKLSKNFVFRTDESRNQMIRENLRAFIDKKNEQNKKNK